MSIRTLVVVALIGLPVRLVAQDARNARLNGKLDVETHAAVMRTRARIALRGGKEICRLDVARSSQPVWATTSQKERVFFVRMNNSTRELPDDELDEYLTDRWPSTN